MNIVVLQLKPCSCVGSPMLMQGNFMILTHRFLSRGLDTDGGVQPVLYTWGMCLFAWSCGIQAVCRCAGASRIGRGQASDLSMSVVALIQYAIERATCELSTRQ